MLILLLLIIFIVLFFVFTEEYLGKYKGMVYLFVAMGFILYSGLRPVGFDRDSQNYENLFMHPDANLSGIIVEPSFTILSKLLYNIYSDVHILLFLYALIGVSIKFYAIKRLSTFYFLPIIIYIGNFFLLHDITQIRVGIASAIFLLSLEPLSEGKKLYAFFYMLLAIFFHYSAIALLPLLILNNNPFSLRMKIAWAFIVPLCFILYVKGLDILTTIYIPYITEKVEYYQALSENKLEKESILNPFPLIKMTVFLYLLYFADIIKQNVPSIYLLIKILGCSLLAYFALSSIKIVSMRISELYGIVELLVYPCLVFTIKPATIGKVVVCVIAFIELYFNLIQWEILDFNI